MTEGVTAGAGLRFGIAGAAEKEVGRSRGEARADLICSSAAGCASHEPPMHSELRREGSELTSAASSLPV